MSLRPQSVHYYYGLYAQDTFKITPKLTATYGLRYGYETGDREKSNLLNYLDTQGPSPIAAQVPSIPNLKGGIGIPGLYGTSDQLQVPEKRHFDPRLGVSYAVDEKTIVHAGFGIFHHPAAAWQQYPNADGGIRVSTSVDAQSNGVVPLTGYSLSNPFPSGLPTPYGNAAGLGIDLGQSIAGPPRQQAIPYQIQYSLDFQRALPANFVITAAYVGNEGNHLMVPHQMNQIPDADLAMGTALTATVKNPFLRCHHRSKLYPGHLDHYRQSVAAPISTVPQLRRNQLWAGPFHLQRGAGNRRASHEAGTGCDLCLHLQ